MDNEKQCKCCGLCKHSVRDITDKEFKENPHFSFVCNKCGALLGLPEIVYRKHCLDSPEAKAHLITQNNNSRVFFRIDDKHVKQLKAITKLSMDKSIVQAFNNTALDELNIKDDVSNNKQVRVVTTFGKENVDILNELVSKYMTKRAAVMRAIVIKYIKENTNAKSK